MNLQVIASPGGDILWVSGPLPGSVHDKKAAWMWGIEDELAAAGLVTQQHTRKPRTGARTSPNRRKKPTAPTRNSAHPASVNAQLKTWRILRKLRCCPWRAGQLARVIHLLQIHEAETG
jgi:hypothetical protein